jgi:antitoxin CptB
MRRGIKEMDIILGRFAESCLDGLDAASLDSYDALLSENDQDLYRWVTGQDAPPDRFSAIVARIAAAAPPAS